MSQKPQPGTVGFVGLGNIGRPMVESLLRAGFDVAVRDVREEAAAPVVAAGARFMKSNQELADAADIIGIAVVNDEQLIDLVTGSGRLVDCCKPGSLLIVHSTVLPSTIREIGASLDEKGIHLLDAQISGGDLRAKEGDLAVMVGGDKAQFDRAADFFAAVGRRAELMGGRGAGATTKTAIQTMTFGNWMAAMESMRIARAAGLDEKKLADFATDTTADSWVAQVWGNYDRLLNTHPLSGSDDLYAFFDKDLFNAVVLARELGVRVPVTAAGSQALGDAARERVALTKHIHAPDAKKDG
jgi:3-hydroxyisobutyrate dehydrogenase-like beta-hydroxyacid dehydrogenase